MLPPDVRVVPTRYNGRPAFLMICPADHRYVRDTEELAEELAVQHASCGRRARRV
ncbi:hypothetical protein ACWEOW_13405 [Monashia sp. NPDC004114]